MRKRVHETFTEEEIRDYAKANWLTMREAEQRLEELIVDQTC